MSDWDWDWILKGSGLTPQDFMPAATPQTPSSFTPPPGADSSATQVPLSAYGAPTTLQDPNAANWDEQTRAQVAMDALNGDLNKRGIAGKTYSDIHDALSDWADAAQPVQGQYATELNGAIYAMPGGGWQIGPAHSNGSLCGANGGCGTNVSTTEGAPDGGMYWGYIHTHPANGGLDIDDINSNNDPSGIGNAAFVSLPDGRIYGWTLGMPWTPDNKQNFASPTDQYLIRPAKFPFGQ